MEWLLALFGRLALLCLWLWTPLVGRAFHGGWLLPLLGLLFLPLTTLVYILVSALWRCDRLELALGCPGIPARPGSA
jgi:hypothetical protein